MSRKHIFKYCQKYQLLFYVAILSVFLYACSTTEKVPEGDYLLTKNTFDYKDGKIFSDQIPSLVAQKPNKKAFFVLPMGLYFYNMVNPKYDNVLKEYVTYPNEMRNQKLRDSLFIKFKQPDFVGKNLFWNRFFYNIGQPPVILSDAKTKQSAKSINNVLINRGYWDATVKADIKRDSAKKTAQVNYIITHKDPTRIKDYYYSISNPTIRMYYERDIAKSFVKRGDILDEVSLEKEINRINELMKGEGYYKFNNDNQNIYFVADSLQSRKNVPLTMYIKKDSLDSPYRKATIGKIDVAVVKDLKDFPNSLKKDSLRGINIYRRNDNYNVNALWLPIILKPGELYNQNDLDLSRRNLIAMNNFTILKATDELRKSGPYAKSDSIIDVQYILRPLPQYEFSFATDLHYSEILNFGFSPSVSLTSRNLFGGAENLVTSFSGIVGTTKDPKKENAIFNAYEMSLQTSLQFPRLLVPFKRYWKIVPKKYSPTTSINIGASMQNNIGLGRINFNTGLTYFANVDNRITHKLTLFNNQLSLTQNKDKYYDYFPVENEIRQTVFDWYAVQHPDINNPSLSYDDISKRIISDQAFLSSLNPEETEVMNDFRQSLLNKDRQTQDVIIASFIYNFKYSEMGNQKYRNPIYLDAKVEVAGNFLNLVTRKENEGGVITDNTKTLFKVPFSQFIKFDFDFRKYFTFFNNRVKPHTLAIRQLVGVGIPYGNSSTMPFIRSYFNGGSYDIRAWTAFGGLGPSDSQLNERVRAYAMDNVKLTTSVEYRFPLSGMFEGALFTDAGNTWGLKDNGYNDKFKFDKFVSQMGVGSGFGIRMNIAYVNIRFDFAYKVHDPNRPVGERWVIDKIQILKPTVNFAIGYPF